METGYGIVDNHLQGGNTNWAVSHHYIIGYFPITAQSMGFYFFLSVTVEPGTSVLHMTAVRSLGNTNKTTNIIKEMLTFEQRTYLNKSFPSGVLRGKF